MRLHQIKGYELTKYINSGDEFTDTLVKNWIAALPDCFTVKFAKDCSRHGSPNEYKIVISKNWFLPVHHS